MKRGVCSDEWNQLRAFGNGVLKLEEYIPVGP
jgi:hypothetical protein